MRPWPRRIVPSPIATEAARDIERPDCPFRGHVALEVPSSVARDAGGPGRDSDPGRRGGPCQQAALKKQPEGAGLAAGRARIQGARELEWPGRQPGRAGHWHSAPAGAWRRMLGALRGRAGGLPRSTPRALRRPSNFRPSGQCARSLARLTMTPGHCGRMPRRLLVRI
jgi:hypothetical protein